DPRPAVGARPRRSRAVELPADGDELGVLVSAALGVLEDGADAAHVHLVIERPRLEGRPLRGEERDVVAPADHGAEAADDPEVVLGVAPVELLPPGLTGSGMRRHVDARSGAADAGGPRALGARDVAARVELGGPLAEVPDVPAR